METVKMIPLKHDEAIHFSIKEYKGNKYFDLRVYFESKQNGQWLPSKEGLTLGTDLLDSVLEGVEALKSEIHDSAEVNKPSDELAKS